MLLLISHVADAQTKQDIVGNWRVDKVYFPTIPGDLPQENQEQLNTIKSAIRQATFTFEENGNCSIVSPHPEFNFKNVKWLYDLKTKQIMVHEKVDPPGSLIRIFVNQQEDGHTYFLIDETDIKLKVKKG